MAIILGKGLTDNVMQEFRQEFRFPTELVKVYNNICTLKSCSGVKRRLQPTALTCPLVILVAVRARGSHEDGMKILSYKERFLQLNLFRLEKRRIQNDHIAAF